ncbi:39S ribosomal protein L33, mitochondrial isoform X1 [Pezoporus wallicus]|uniref:39S ribosomal protein L33, mitochondrial isoform X1 n=1 Tax=Pezoporus wallicus TaxID=35540 RepID=UPI0025500E98|nr:39S ribosomal protein L33, mitochondrial isoform X1 [Pezoporus wallicus]XP_061331238.1 large ribosomal subunit protein bL33m isoform X1 [Pezoporus flaviventris]
MGELKEVHWSELHKWGRMDVSGRYILVRMKSAAETGYCFNVRRLRLQEKLVLYKYDPIAKQRVLFTEKRKIRSL